MVDYRDYGLVRLQIYVSDEVALAISEMGCGDISLGAKSLILRGIAEIKNDPVLQQEAEKAMAKARMKAARKEGGRFNGSRR